MTRTGRQLVFVGPGQPLELRTVDVPDPDPGAVVLRTVLGGVCGTNRSLRVIGSMGPATLDDYRTTIALAERHGRRLAFGELITHRFPLGDAAAAIAAAGSGEAIKAVVVPGLGEPVP